MNEIKKLAMYKIEGEDFDDNEFLVFLHVQIDRVVAIVLNEDEINCINLAGLEEDSILDISIDDEYIQNNILTFDTVDTSRKKPLVIEDIEQLLYAQIFYSGTVNEIGIKKLVSLLKANYETKVSISTFEDTVFSVEGVKIDIVDINSDYEKCIDKDCLMIDQYPYTQPIDGEATVDELKNQRLRPLIKTIVPKSWW